MSNAIVAKTGFALPAIGRISTAVVHQAMAAAFWAADRVVAYARRQKAIDVLMGMDDRQLKDLGISRGEIPAHVDGRFDTGYRGRP